MVMCFYNLFIFLGVRDVAYWYCILYVLSMAGNLLVLTGLGFQYFWMETPECLFLATMSHELRRPINAICVFLN